MSNYRFLIYTLLLLIGVVTGYGCGSEYTPDEPDRPYRLTDVDITPETPSLNDTIRLKVSGDGDKSYIASYNWIIEQSVHTTNGDSLKWYNKEDKLTIEGKVEAKLQNSAYHSFTESLDFKIRFQQSE